MKIPFLNKKAKKHGVWQNPTHKFKNLRKTRGASLISEKRTPYPQLFSNLKTARKRRKDKKVNSALLPPTRLKHKKEFRFKKLFSVLLILLIMGGSAYLAFFTGYFQITDFKIFEDQTEITTNLELNKIIEQELQGKNILLFGGGTLKDTILKNHPEFKTVKIGKSLPAAVVIHLEKYPQTANIVALITDEDGIRTQKKYIVNVNGMIIKENEENPDLPYVETENKAAWTLGDTPVPSEKLDYIIKTINLFEEKIGIRVISSKYMKRARELHLLTEKDFTVWIDMNYMNRENNMIPQINKLKKALSKLDIYNTPLQYIDLRIAGTEAEKVIFKRR